MTYCSRMSPSLKCHFALTTYPGRHCNYGFDLGTKVQAHDSDVSHNSEDAQADEKYEIYLYTHILHHNYLYYVYYITLRFFHDIT